MTLFCCNCNLTIDYTARYNSQRKNPPANMYSMSQFRIGEDIEHGMREGKQLTFFEKNPKGRLVGTTKKITMIDVSLPADTVADVSKTGKDNKNKKYQEEQPQTKKCHKNYNNAERNST